MDDSFRSAVKIFSASVLMLLCAFASLAAGDRFEIRSAYVVPSQGVYLLNARLHFVMPEGARQAVRDGVALTLQVDLQLVRSRNWWLDDSVASLEQRYEVVYHALSERYLLRNLNSGEQSTHGTLDEALESLSAIHDLPVLDESLIRAKEDYELRLRGTLDVRTLPEALRVVLFWVDNWRQRTEWYIWPLKI